MDVCGCTSPYQGGGLHQLSLGVNSVSLECQTRHRPNPGTMHVWLAEDMVYLPHISTRKVHNSAFRIYTVLIYTVLSTRSLTSPQFSESDPSCDLKMDDKSGPLRARSDRCGAPVVGNLVSEKDMTRKEERSSMRGWC